MRLPAIVLAMITACANGQDNTDLMYRVVRAPNRAKARALLGITNYQTGSLNLSNWSQLSTGILATVSASTNGVYVAVAGSLLGARTNGNLVTISNRYEAQAGNQNITNWGTITTNNLGKQVAVAGTFLVAFTNINLVTLSNLYTPQLNMFVTNKTITNTWIGSNFADSNVTALLSFTADGNMFEVGWNTHLQVKWDGFIDAFPELKTWVEFKDVYNVTTTNMMFDLLPSAGRYLSYYIDESFPMGGNFRPNVAVNVDYGWTAGTATLNPISNSVVTLYAQRIGTASLVTGGLTNVATYTVRNKQ